MSPEETQNKIDAAVFSARAWLDLIDSSRYQDSWEEAAVYFKGLTAKEQWEDLLKGARTPLGNLKSRTVQSAQLATSLPGAPDGEYVVIQFVSSFEKKKNAQETLTPMLDPDGVWRVAGYFIQ